MSALMRKRRSELNGTEGKRVSLVATDASGKLAALKCHFDHKTIHRSNKINLYIKTAQVDTVVSTILKKHNVNILLVCSLFWCREKQSLSYI